jgi:hypothetical protein
VPNISQSVTHGPQPIIIAMKLPPANEPIREILSRNQAALMQKRQAVARRMTSSLPAAVSIGRFHTVNGRRTDIYRIHGVGECVLAAAIDANMPKRVMPYRNAWIEWRWIAWRPQKRIDYQRNYKAIKPSAGQVIAKKVNNQVMMFTALASTKHQTSANRSD